MSPANQPSTILYEFGSFRLDPCGRVLLRNQDLIPLSPKAFDTLLVFVEYGGHVLSKNELLSKVWPDTVVEEGNLTQQIYVLRKALGRSSKGIFYIETVPKRGYRFNAGVREIKPARADPRVRSIAVLPFRSLTTKVEPLVLAPRKIADLDEWFVSVADSEQSTEPPSSLF